MPDFDSVPPWANSVSTKQQEAVSAKQQEALSKELRDKARQLKLVIQREDLKRFLTWVKNQNRAFLSDDHLITAYQEELENGDQRKEDQPVEGSQASS